MFCRCIKSLLSDDKLLLQTVHMGVCENQEAFTSGIILIVYTNTQKYYSVIAYLRVLLHFPFQMRILYEQEKHCS